MMMNYLSKDSRKKRNNFFLFLFLIVFLFFYSELKNVFFGVFEFISYPVWVSENYINEHTINPSGFLISKKTLLFANEQLKKDLNEAELMLSDRNALLKENLELKEIMGRTNNQNLILASVLAKPNISVYDTVIVDAGNNIDIKEGSKVFVLGNILIGEVEEVNNRTSKIKLFSSPKEKLEVMIGFGNIITVATGKGAGNFEMEVPRDVDVEVGDPVVSVGINSPTLGSVEEIISDPINPFKKVLFKSPVNLFEIKWVQILKQD